MTMTVTHERAAARYVAYEGETVRGWIDYDTRGGALRLLHTEVPPSDREHGVGSAVVRAILDEIRASTSSRMVALCPFVRAWLERHPDYNDLMER